MRGYEGLLSSTKKAERSGVGREYLVRVIGSGIDDISLTRQETATSGSPDFPAAAASVSPKVYLSIVFRYAAPLMFDVAYLKS